MQESKKKSILVRFPDEKNATERAIRAYYKDRQDKFASMNQAILHLLELGLKQEAFHPNHKDPDLLIKDITPEHTRTLSSLIKQGRTTTKEVITEAKE